MKKKLGNIWFMTKYMLKYGKSFFPIAFLSGMMQALTIAIEVVGIRYVLDALFVGQTFQALTMVITLYAGATLLTKIYYTWNGYFNPMVVLKISIGMSKELMEKSLQMGFSCFDDPVYYDLYTRAVSDADRTMQGLVGSYIAIFSNTISVVTIVGIMATLGVEFILIALVNVIISSVVIVLQNKWNYSYEMAITRTEREMGYFKGLFFNPATGKEIRLFDSAAHFIGKYQTSAVTLWKKTKKFRLKMQAPKLGENIVNCGTLVLTMLLSGAKIIAGGISVGTFVSTINAVNSLTDQLFSLFAQFPIMMQYSRYIQNIRKVVEAEDPIEKKGLENGCSLSKKNNHRIEFRNVSFTYPTGEKEVLHHVCFTVPEGEKFVVVGENGSGKTTMIKLLFRLYDPTQGEILIDGRDIREYNVKSLRNAFTTVFQDFQTYATTVGENITFEKLANAPDAVENALDMAQFRERVERIPEGTHASMTKMFDDNGIVLSGGEAQKLSIARAFFKEAGMIVMDEPSSALDPLAEYALTKILFSSIREKTAVIVSHRLRLCPTFDRILYFENGQIAEEGTHQELMNLRGKYHLMYTTQYNNEE